jgi:hypothetical protein
VSSEALMYRMAARRGQVRVKTPSGDIRTATLVAWRPHDGRNRARVQFPTGGFRSVNVGEVYGPDNEYKVIGGQWHCRYGDGSWLPISDSDAADIQAARS